MKEFILCAAIEYKGNIVCGYRHKDCYKLLEALDNGIVASRKEQGFMTSLNRFVDRKEGWKIAKKNDQIQFGQEASENGDESELISENLY